MNRRTSKNRLIAVQISALLGVCRYLSASIVGMSGTMEADITAGAVDLIAFRTMILAIRLTVVFVAILTIAQKQPQYEHTNRTRH